MNALLIRALKATSEFSDIEFKDEFDIASKRHWCEIIKDIVAIANSGGGVILFGLDDNGLPTGADVLPILVLDPADMINRISKYVDFQLVNFSISETEKSGRRLAALTIDGLPIPLIFQKPGTYPVTTKKQKTAFGQGTIYFRHGAKSEPGNLEDLREVISRELNIVREEWLGNIRKVIEADPGTSIVILPSGEDSLPKGTVPVRLTDDPNAPALLQIDRDETHPYRQTELIKKVRERLGTDVWFNQYDVTCIKGVHELTGNSLLCYQPKFATMQYSDAMVDWIVTQYQSDNYFFAETRDQYRKKQPPRQWKKTES